MVSTIALTGADLSLEHFVAVTRQKVPVMFAGWVKERLEASRDVLNRMLDGGEIIYGVNTGFGGNVKFLIPSTEIAAHQRGMLRHLYCGTGLLLDADLVRGAILLRANALAKGFSAVGPIV